MNGRKRFGTPGINLGGRRKIGRRLNIMFPIKGLHKGFQTERQPGLTSFNMLNVRPYDPLSNRLRGGQRPGLVKWGEGTLIGGAEQPIVAICSISSVI